MIRAFCCTMQMSIAKKEFPSLTQRNHVHTVIDNIFCLEYYHLFLALTIKRGEMAYYTQGFICYAWERFVGH